MGLAELMTSLRAGAVMIHPARMFVEYSPYTAFSIRGRRFHLPLGSYSTSYPHAGFLYQLGISRPRLVGMSMGEGIMPTHMHGLKLAGTAWLNDGFYSAQPPRL